MKKIILIVFTILNVNTIKAQQIIFGPKAGITMASLRNSKDTNNDDNSTPLIAYHLGGFAEFNFNEGFIVQPEILYDIVGYTSTKTVNKVEKKYRSERSYLTVPIMFKYYFKPDYALEVGPQVGVLLSTKNTTSTNSKKALKSIDLGMNVGISYTLTDRIYLTARYCYGILDTKVNRASDDKNRAYNNALQLSIGYSL